MTAGGAIHTNSSEPIRMEVQVQAFTFNGDEINDMTFQRYKLINHCTTEFGICYFAMWIDQIWDVILITLVVTESAV